MHAPRFAYDAVIQQSRAVITGAPFGGAGDSPLYADVNAKIAALVSGGKIDTARAEELRAAAAAALIGSVQPAYEALIAWAETDRANSDEIATGVWKLPDGPAYYTERLAASTTTAMTADEIHELGLAEVARIQAEMEAIKRQVGFDGTLQEFFASLRGNPQFLFPNTDEGREGYLQTSRDYYAGIEARLPEYFGLLPKAGLVVKRVEAFREQPGAAQHYQQGTRDGSRPGTYYVHLIDMNSMPKVELETVAYHEGIPGHHMQISIQQELSSVPMFRTQSRYTAYIEGWGLYAERLAKEMGGFDDPYSDFGRLGGEIWRAIRLVVDTGLALERLDRAASRRLLPRQRPDVRGASARGDPPLHRHAGPSDGVQGRHAEDPRAARASRGGARRPTSTSAASTTPCSAAARCRSRFSSAESTTGSPRERSR